MIPSKKTSRNLLGTSAQPLKTTCNLLIIWLRGSFEQVARSLLVGYPRYDIAFKGVVYT